MPGRGYLCQACTLLVPDLSIRYVLAKESLFNRSASFHLKTGSHGNGVPPYIYRYRYRYTHTLHLYI